MLRDSAMERFLTTPLEEREKSEQVKSLKERLSSNETIIAKLEKELNDVIAERDSEVCKHVLFNSIHIYLFKSKLCHFIVSLLIRILVNKY